MEIVYTYLVPTEYVGTMDQRIEITRKVFDGDKLLMSTTVYDILVIGHSGIYHQGWLRDLFTAKEREVSQTYKDKTTVIHSFIDKEVHRTI